MLLAKTDRYGKINRLNQQRRFNRHDEFETKAEQGNVNEAPRPGPTYSLATHVHSMHCPPPWRSQPQPSNLTYETTTCNGSRPSCLLMNALLMELE